MESSNDALSRPSCAPDLGGFEVALTGIAGYEAEVLRLRNANRSEAKSMEYVLWRYRQQEGVPEARIAWLVDASGSAVGMAACVFRPFCIDGAVSDVGVLGDISLDEGLRGRGLGQRLLFALTRELERAGPSGRAFVIPTQAARRSLDALGWRRAGSLIPYVCPIDPARHLGAFGRSRILAAAITLPARSALSLLVGVQRSRDVTLHDAGFDAQFEELWRDLPKSGLVMSDRSCSTLCWRYASHPSRQFHLARLDRAGSLRGYVVFEEQESEQAVSIQDLVVADVADLRGLLAGFMKHCLAREWVSSIRISLNERHPYSGHLFRLGFMRRAASGEFQVFEPRGNGFPGHWWLMPGDKDI